MHQWRNKEYAACLNRAEEISREFKSLLVHFRSVSELEDEADSKSVAEKYASSNLVTAIYVHMAEFGIRA